MHTRRTHTHKYTHAHTHKGVVGREGKLELDQEWDNRSPGIVAIDGWIDG